ncbi:hypothetical protein [Haladaptatus pallidirubidus]|nr:hypothetical protein [Haladaptatus pallidirubidus]
MQARTGHQFLGHIVGEDYELVVCGLFVVFIGDVDQTEGFDIEGEFVGRGVLIN